MGNVQNEVIPSVKSESVGSESMDTDIIPSQKEDQQERTLTRETFDHHINVNTSYHLRLLLDYTSAKLREYDGKLTSLSKNVSMTERTGFYGVAQSPEIKSVYNTYYYIIQFAKIVSKYTTNILLYSQTTLKRNSNSNF